MPTAHVGEIVLDAAPAFEGRLFIDGTFAEAATGETFATHDPATGEVIAEISAVVRRTSIAPSVRHAALSTKGRGRG